MEYNSHQRLQRETVDTYKRRPSSPADRLSSQSQNSRSRDPEARLSQSRTARSYRGTYRRRKRKRRRRFNLLPVLLIVLILAVIGIIVFLIVHKNTQEPEETTPTVTETSETVPEETTEPEPTTAASEAVLLEASRLAAQYDYDAAIDLIYESGIDTEEGSEGAEAIRGYEEIKAALIRQEPTEITHIFFHSLVVDTSLAFDGDSKATGYNQVMTTVDEFNRILEQMYERGYVLVSLHDIAKETEDPENGGMKMEYNDIMLPEGKKAFVMSQDDLCYYEYQQGDGLATRIIVGDDGRPTCEYRNPDGSTSIGSYDMVPLLDDFIDEHPDFSYRGAKAAIAFTGYNGILGYRTDESYDPSSARYDAKLADAPNNNIEADREAAVKVLKALYDDGYELASHSWGHLDMGKISMDRFTTDCDKWDKNVNSLIREATGAPCDIIIYPKGADIGSWHGYSQESINKDGNHPDGYQRFCYLHDLGFRYYCNVDSSQYFVQKGNDFFRMGRRNVDGDRMWRDIANPEKAKLNDLIDVNSVFDKARPTPVPGY